MSASLLQKSLKLTEENKGSKKKNLKKKKHQNCKWRKTIQSPNNSREKQAKDNILKNIKKLEELDTPVSLEISKKVLSRRFKEEPVSLKPKEEEKTVFTDKDFEDFAKEYFAS